MLSVGLTGGIGAGKSAVAARLVERGAVLVDSDLLAREVVAPGTPGLAEIVAAFGDTVRAADGALDRPALGALVFDAPDARRRLEAIIHPRVRARSAELAAAAPPDAIVVHDVPLLVEVGLAPTYHLVLVVEADRDVRIARLVRDRGMTADHAAARIAAQADDARRRAAADVLLRNDRTPADLHRTVDALWPRLQGYAQGLATATPADPDPAVVPANPDWPAQAARLAARIRHALGALPADRSAAPEPTFPVEHVGPTAVAGMAAVDHLDLQVGLPPGAAPGLSGSVAAELRRIGFPARSPGVHGSADPGRPATIHLRVAGSPAWVAALDERDRLGSGPGRTSGV
jgi:dephospho-CoA kinase